LLQHSAISRLYRLGSGPLAGCTQAPVDPHPVARLGFFGLLILVMWMAIIIIIIIIIINHQSSSIIIDHYH